MLLVTKITLTYICIVDLYLLCCQVAVLALTVFAMQTKVTLPAGYRGCDIGELLGV